MSPEFEIAALQTKNTSLENKLSTLEQRLNALPRDNSTAQIGTLLNKLDVLTREVQTMQTRLSSFRGADGVKVQGCVISLDRGVLSTLGGGGGDGLGQHLFIFNENGIDEYWIVESQFSSIVP